MKTAIAKRWVEALRSGKYEQGRRILKNVENEYCCLGVLCDLYLIDNNKKWKSKDTIQGTETLCEKERFALPEKVMKWAGLSFTGCDDKEVVISKKSQTYTLAYANDTEKYSFEKIADIIETEFLTDNE